MICLLHLSSVELCCYSNPLEHKAGCADFNISTSKYICKGADLKSPLVGFFPGLCYSVLPAQIVKGLAQECSFCQGWGDLSVSFIAPIELKLVFNQYAKWVCMLSTLIPDSAEWESCLSKLMWHKDVLSVNSFASSSTHMQDLQEVTQDLHYENFRSERLKRGSRLSSHGYMLLSPLLNFYFAFCVSPTIALLWIW